MSAIRDEIVEWAYLRDQRAKARQERTKNRIHCPVCGARIGQCKMRHATCIVGPNAKPDDGRASPQTISHQGRRQTTL